MNIKIYREFWWGLLILIVGFHLILLLGNVGAFFVLPFWAPWYIAIPLWGFLLRTAFNRDSQYNFCPLSSWENQVRRKLGLPQIKGFIANYFWHPIKYRKWPR